MIFRNLAVSLVALNLLWSSSVFCHAQAGSSKAWNLLTHGLAEKDNAKRVTAVRVLGLLPSDAQAVELARHALNDKTPEVRAAAATALGQLHATDALPQLRKALYDSDLHVIMAAAHAVQLLNDPICYEVYYEFLTGKRKDNSGMVAQEMKVLRDPRQIAEMGFDEGIGYIPFASMGWEAVETILKDRSQGAAAKAALISALATDPDPQADAPLVTESRNQNWVVRVAAVEAIAKRGKSALSSKIEGLLDDPRYEVRYAAAAAIIRLGDMVVPR